MASYSSSLAWKIPWMEEPGRLQFIGVAEGQTQLSDFTFTFHFHALENEMATHSSVLAWRIPGMGETGGLPFMGSHRVGTRLKRCSSSSLCTACTSPFCPTSRHPPSPTTSPWWPSSPWSGEGAEGSPRAHGARSGSFERRVPLGGRESSYFLMLETPERR